MSQVRSLLVGNLLAAAVLCFGCSSEPEGPSVALRADVERLRRLMIGDPARQPLEEVERVVEGRPVLAGRMLRQGGLPAARRQVERVSSAQEGFRSPEGQRLARRALAAYRARVEALESYADVLEDAATDEEAWLNALRAQSQAELELMAIDADMEGIVPTARRPRGQPGSAPGPRGPPGARPRGGGAH